MGIPSDISEDKWLNKGGWEVIVLDKKKDNLLCPRYIKGDWVGSSVWDLV